MASSQGFTQEPHKLLLIPGPIEVADEVLYANAHPSMSHMSPDFSRVFGNCIRMLRKVLFTQDGQVFLVAGSGTLGWDQVAANLLEPGDEAVVLNSGYFGDGLAECIETYGAKVTQIRANVGAAPTPEDVEAMLKTKKFKLLTITHVDTSTGVLSDVKRIADTVRRVSPETLVILDGVCSVGSEEIRFDDWGIDVVVTASQKGLGCPPGLSITCASRRAIKVSQGRKHPVNSYYASWARWLPIMHAYESGSAKYFATPPVNLVYALHASLMQITEAVPSLEERFRLHKEASFTIKKELQDLGLNLVTLDPYFSANGMTAAYYPPGKGPSDVIQKLSDDGITVAGGIHQNIRDKYFRIGHMGISVTQKDRGDMVKLIASLRRTFS